jgi:hypothetical protein
MAEACPRAARFKGFEPVVSSARRSAMVPQAQASSMASSRYFSEIPVLGRVFAPQGIAPCSGIVHRFPTLGFKGRIWLRIDFLRAQGHLGEFERPLKDVTQGQTD